MKKSYFRLLKRKTKDFLSISLEIIVGSEPTPDYEKLKQKHLRELFNSSINWMPEIESLYDKGFDLYKDPEKAANYTLQFLTLC